MAGVPEEADFVELQLPISELTFDRLLRECCRELNIDGQVWLSRVPRGGGAVTDGEVTEADASLHETVGRRVVCGSADWCCKVE